MTPDTRSAVERLADELIEDVRQPYIPGSNDVFADRDTLRAAAAELRRLEETVRRIRAEAWAGGSLGAVLEICDAALANTERTDADG